MLGYPPMRQFLLLQYRQAQAGKSIHAHLMNHEAAFHDRTDPTDIFYASERGSGACDVLDFLFIETIPQVITLFSIYAEKTTKQRRESGIKGYRAVVLNGQTDHEIEAHASSLDTYMKLEWRKEIFGVGSASSLGLVRILGEFPLIALVVRQIGATVGSVVAFRGYWSLLRSPLQFFIHVQELEFGY
ncbi:ABC transporter, transmembrane domain, type 1 [Penicillium occitanis (nom. inval.)]|nr:hypothetical protein PENOC_111630 [Penicillium occitanis (nom. inval.)]PCG88398.1 ABC transporter, transmembrane domain, type 1 [Penicillium occitanis (nom. inval.)]